MSIPIFITPELQAVLAQHNIAPESYTPAYGGESAGLDLYCTGPSKIIVSKEEGTSVLVPTGLKIALPNDMVGLILDRGSISKTLAVRRAGVVDPGWNEVIWVNLLLDSEADIPAVGSKLPAQLLCVPVQNKYQHFNAEQFASMTFAARRKAGQLGSSDVVVN